DRALRRRANLLIERQRLQEKTLRLRQVARAMGERSLPDLRIRDADPVLPRPAQIAARLEITRRLRDAILPRRDHAQVREAAGLSLALAQFAPERQALLQQAGGVWIGGL